MKLAENVTVLGNRHFQIYALGSEPMVLLEGGVSAVVPTVADQLVLRSLPVEISHLVIMHAHFDHVCGIPGLQKMFPAALVAGSKEAQRVLHNTKIVAKFFKEDAAMTEVLKEQCLLGDALGLTAEDTIDVEQVIQDGEKWELGAGVTLHFYHAPGHSPCSLMAYLPEREMLFSSDCAGFPVNGRCIYPIFFEGYEKYIRTIDRMMDLSVYTLACAHECISRGRKQVKEFLSLARTEAESVRDLVVNAGKKGLDKQVVIDLLMDQYYTDNLRIYTEQNIRLCCEILIRRASETAQ